MNADYNGARVLVTGGTGSFGHTVARRMLERDLAEIRVLSRDEAKQDLMRHEMKDQRLSFYVGAVRDYLSVPSSCSRSAFNSRFRT